MPKIHDDETRARILALVNEVGRNEACRRTGIPRGTVYRWQHPDKAAEYSRRASSRQNTGVCATCGRSSRKDIDRCQRCREEAVDDMVARRNQGQGLFTIAVVYGRTPETVKSLIEKRRQRS